MIRNLRNTLIAAGAAAILAACGGGSSGSSSGPGPAGGDDPAAITLDNAELAAGIVAGVALGDGVFGAMSGVEFPSALGPISVITEEVAKVANPSQLMATSSGMADCAMSGTVDVDITISDPSMPTEGDIYAIQFNACNDGDGTVTDGGMILRITGVDGDFESGLFLLGISMELSAFQVTEGGETTGANGTVSVSIDTRTPPFTTITVSTSALATSSDGTAEAVSDLTVTISEDDSMFPVAVSVNTSFTISSPRLGGEVTVSSGTPGSTW